MPKIDSAAMALLVEDEPQDRKQLREQLERIGFTVIQAEVPEQAQSLLAQSRFDIVLVHSSSRPLEAVDLCREIRATSTVPILAVTEREDTVAEAQWLSAGADDYLVKPVDSRILRARVAQQLERVSGNGNGNGKVLSEDEQSWQMGSADESQIYKWGPLSLNIDAHEFEVNGQPMPLTRTEFLILQLLMRRPSQVFSRDQILDSIGMISGNGTNHIVDTHISRIRTKVRRAGGPEIMKVVRSVGFRLSDSSGGQAPHT